MSDFTFPMALATNPVTVVRKTGWRHTAVQMLVIEIDDPWLEDQLDQIADMLNNDERYRPAQFAAMLATLSEPEPEPEPEHDTDIETEDEPIE